MSYTYIYHIKINKYILSNGIAYIYDIINHKNIILLLICLKSWHLNVEIIILLYKYIHSRIYVSIEYTLFTFTIISNSPNLILMFIKCMNTFHFFFIPYFNSSIWRTGNKMNIIWRKCYTQNPWAMTTKCPSNFSIWSLISIN